MMKAGILLWLLLCSTVLPAAAQSRRMTVRPADTGAALVNPGMGWQFHHFDNNITTYSVDLKPSDGVREFPGVGSVYIRLAWSYIEPREDHFEWSIVDSAMQRWVTLGKRVAFRFTCMESDPKQPFATPKWVMEAGAKGYRVKNGKEDPVGETWEPDYDDPIFLDKLDHFLAAAAEHYDGHPDIEFIDVGSFGTWGEGHTFAGSTRPYSAATVRKHIDLHLNHFHKTLLVANDDFANQGRGLETLLYARDHGLALRDDSILVEPAPHSYHHAFLAYQFWPQVPVILEGEHYGGSVEHGAWGDGSGLLRAIEDYHASYMTAHWYPREFLAKNRSVIDQANLRLGYRLQLVEASWPEEVAAGAAAEFGYLWRNAGVAPCYRGGHPAITLKDADGGISGVFVDAEMDVRTLPVAAPGAVLAVGRHANGRNTQRDRALLSVQLPPSHLLAPGEYDVLISVGDATGKPLYELPLAQSDGARRYRLGTLRVVPAR